MVNPVPGKSITTPYGKRGRSWSCNSNSQGGIHTGADFAAPNGTTVVAARSGTVRHTSYGSAFGSKQFAIRCSDGTEDFYAHTRTRPSNGKQVKAGDKVAEVGALGNVTGPHLHFERHKTQGSWNCSVHVNPQPSIDHQEANVNPGKVHLSKLVQGQRDSDSVKRLQAALNDHTLVGGKTISVSGNFLTETANEVRLCQQQHGFGNDPMGSVNVGPRQAAHLFAGTGNEIVDDLEEPEPPPVTPPPTEPPVTDKRFIYHYSGKPSGKQSIGTTYQDVDKGSFTPPDDGLLFSMIYLNCDHTFDSGVDSAGLRVRAVRAPHGGQGADNTAYQDYTPNRRLTQPGEFLLTHIWFEMAEGNRKIQWQVDRSSAFNKFELGTRYTKWVWISKVALQQWTPLDTLSLLQILSKFFGADPDEETTLAL